MKHQAIAIVTFLLLGTALVVSGCGGTQSAPPLHGGRLEPPKVASDFTLTNQDGNPFSLSSTKGKVVMLYFGYTSCPDVCPLTLADMASARSELGDAADQVQILFVTVDPERDSQAVLKKYVPAFDPGIIGLRGTPEEIKTVADAYGVKYKKTPLKDSALGYAMDHSAFIYVVDRNGQLRELLPYGTQRQDITSDLKILINEGISS